MDKISDTVYTIFSATMKT